MKRETLNHSLFKVFEKIGRERGFSSESLTENALKNLLKSVWWITGFRKATDNEDKKRGIDFVIETTNVGDIFLQVKSSEIGKKESLKKHPKIPVVIINRGLTLEEIQKRIKKTLSNQRDYYLSKKITASKNL